MSDKRFLQKSVLRFSTKIFRLYELVIKWRVEPKDMRSTPQTRRGGFGVSLPAKYDAAVTNLVSFVASINLAAKNFGTETR